MELFNTGTICPYTGLRSFTEEESLYFRGRDEQIDNIVELLSSNNFLMVTGASGEGKSSLIFAGLIPNARAGFFKARYSSWMVSSFRPERDPVGNMARSLASAFDTSAESIETELSRGYSALTDLYTSSEHYNDETNGNQGKNLMLIVDQFEEFFTNPENFFNNAPSNEAQVVVNLILETARIAKKRNLPIYIVCTMRSDYIGQCSAFRGLPEFIGYSQFFVPRLKRKDLKQVIEEPAEFNGNKISQRLVERLLYDISEGADQLPLLQHALSRIWRLAKNGEEELDLIHYAMAGGLNPEDLPEEDQPRYHEWFEQLSPSIQQFYGNYTLNAVIEVHANSLYEGSLERFTEEYVDTSLSKKQIKRVAALSFACLTKIDSSRAVRNRMTIGEIAEIINEESITWKEVSTVLADFRKDGNSFLRPYIMEDEEEQVDENTVLDITHESLIRNWGKLRKWANKEHEYYATYLDFIKQIKRWKASGKQSSYLLPIGPLSFFEAWYEESKPNAAWISRYKKEDEVEGKTRMSEARQEMDDIREFLRRSAKKVYISRLFMRYGPQRIAATLAITVLVLLTSFYWYDAEQKRNERVIKEVVNRTDELYESKDIPDFIKANAIVTGERYSPDYLVNKLQQFGLKEESDLYRQTYQFLLGSTSREADSLHHKFIRLADKKWMEIPINEIFENQLLENYNNFISNLAYDDYFSTTSFKQEVITRHTERFHELALYFLDHPEYITNSEVTELNFSIQMWLVFGAVNSDKVNEILAKVSPFTERSNFDEFYPQNRFELNGNSRLNYNGGIHTIASLYAVLGDGEHVVKSFELLHELGLSDYFIGSLFNNYNNILGYFYAYGHEDQAEIMVKWLSENYESDTPLTIYRNAVIRSGYMSRLNQLNQNKGSVRNFFAYIYPNLYFGSKRVFEKLSAKYNSLAEEVADPNERNYLLAINKKRTGVYLHKFAYDRNQDIPTTKINRLFNEAVKHFDQIEDSYLDGKVSITYPYFIGGIRSQEFSRKHLFIYPDYMEGWFSNTYHSDVYFNYLKENGLLPRLFQSKEDLEMMSLWLSKYKLVLPNAFDQFYQKRYPLPLETIRSIANFIEGHPQGGQIDNNRLFLELSNAYFKEGNLEQAMEYYSKFSVDEIRQTNEQYEYIEKTYFTNSILELASNLAINGHHDDAKMIAEQFDLLHERVYTYVITAERLFDYDKEQSLVYIDSALSKTINVSLSAYDYGNGQAYDFRSNIIYLLNKVGGRTFKDLANKYLREQLPFVKYPNVALRAQGIASQGYYYLAMSSIPSDLIDSPKLAAYTGILWVHTRNVESEESSDVWRRMDDFIDHNLNYIDFNPA